MGSAHYIARAFELETAAAQVSSPAIRASYLELARSFREMANLVSVAASSDEEAVRLAERMVGNPMSSPENAKRA